MRKLCLVRHCQPVIDSEADSHDWLLSGAGRQSCAALATQLRGVGVGVIVTSTEPKAAETGAIVAERLGVPLEAAEDLGEHDRRGAPFFPARGSFADQVADLFRRPGELVFGNETADQAYARFAAAVDRLLLRHPEGSLAIVSHGTVITLFVARRAGVEPVSFWRELGLPAVVVLNLPGFELLQVLNRLPS